MKLVLILSSLLVIVLILLLFIKGVNSRKGAPPGLMDGVLTQCSSKPNCVCSEYTSDSKNYVKPINLSPETMPDSLSVFKDIIQAMGGVVHTEESHYLSSEFSSSIFGFVDDLEIRLDMVKSIIHLRSSSREGTSDFGVNEKRINTFKNLFKKHHEK